MPVQHEGDLLKYILSLTEGERLPLGAPAAGELLIKALPEATPGGYVAGAFSLQPNGFIPRCRCLQTDEVWFVHKGQGRAAVGEEQGTIVPGMLVHVPRGTWHTIRNTGTGLLQLILLAHPAGLEAFYREVSKLGSSPSLEALVGLGARYGIEFDGQAAAAPLAPPIQRRERHGRRRRRGKPTGTAARTPVEAVGGSAEDAIQPAEAPAEPRAPAGPPVARPESGRRRNRRGGRRHRGPGAPRAAQGSAPPHAPQPSAPRPELSRAPAPPAEPSGEPAGGPVKEVYMNGRWVRVSGEGPVIAPGRERFFGRRSGRPRRPRGSRA